jgi:hypothetical protein
MEDVLTYLEEVLGIRITPVPMGKSALGQLPVYINESYELFNVNIFNRDVVFAAPKSEVGFRVLQTDKQVLQIRSRLNKTVVLVLKNIQAFNRNRLVQKGVNFIVASKQLYLPDLLIDSAKANRTNNYVNFEIGVANMGLKDSINSTLKVYTNKKELSQNKEK